MGASETEGEYSQTGSLTNELITFYLFNQYKRQVVVADSKTKRKILQTPHKTITLLLPCCFLCPVFISET